MADEEERHDTPEEKKKQKHLLWWGLGLAGVGVVIGLIMLANNNAGATSTIPSVSGTTPVDTSGTTSTGTNGSTSGTASEDEYWPPSRNWPKSSGSGSNTNGGGDVSTHGNTTNTGPLTTSGSTSTSGVSGSNKKATAGFTQTIFPQKTASGNSWEYIAGQGQTLNSIAAKYGGGHSGSWFQNYSNNAAILKQAGITSPNQPFKTGLAIEL